MSKSKLTRKLFTYLWQRYVAGKSGEQAAEIAGIAPEAFEEHRAKRTPQYIEAEQRLAEAIPDEALITFAKAAQLRLLTAGPDSTAASVAARVLEQAVETKQPASITFIIAPADEPAADDAEAPTGAEQHKPAAGPAHPQRYVLIPEQAAAHYNKVIQPMAAAGAAAAVAKAMAPADKKAPSRKQLEDDARPEEDR